MLFISPPFGNYVWLPNTISITGSFTLYPREGKWKQIFRTLRYSWKYGCWCNKIGLRNPGIEYAIQQYAMKKNTITSVAILNAEDIEPLVKKIPTTMNIELNISCPNTDHAMVSDNIDRFIHSDRKYCIVKLSPLDTMDRVDRLYSQGFRQFHCSNTLPIKELSDCKYEGGMSGSILIPYTVSLVKQIRTRYPDTEIIAGGGVQDHKIKNRYIKLGANHISISTLCFHPIKFSIFYGKWLYELFIQS